MTPWGCPTAPSTTPAPTTSATTSTSRCAWRSRGECCGCAALPLAVGTSRERRRGTTWAPQLPYGCPHRSQAVGLRSPPCRALPPPSLPPSPSPLPGGVSVNKCSGGRCAAACRLLTAKSISGSAGSCAGIDGCSSAASPATCLPCCRPDGVLGSGQPPPPGWDESRRGCVPDRAQGEGSRVTAPGHAQEPPAAPSLSFAAPARTRARLFCR